MRKSVFSRLTGRVLSKGLLTVAAAALLAGCSNSVERFQNAYENPSDADPVYTASVPKSVQKPINRKRAIVAAPDAADDDFIVESPVARAPLPKAPKAQTYDYTENYEKTYKQPKPKFRAPVYEEPIAAEDEIAPSVSSKAVASNGSVIVGRGMTLSSIARANNVDPMELAAHNKLKPPYHVWSGQRIRIPADDMAENLEPLVRKSKTGIAMAEEEPVQQKPASRAKSAAVHTVNDGETLYSLGRKYGVSPFVIADANGFSHNQGLNVGQKVKIPGSAQVIAEAETEVTPLKKPVKKKAALSLVEDDSVVADETPVAEQPAQTAKVKALPNLKAEPETEMPVAQTAAADTLNLRWPLKGKVISNYGPKNNGLKNEGINIAVPEGTSIRAAEGGVVAYAGNELKGYGNLVLIRHAGGYVTAYAHAKELLVKRGDAVKRGDVVAKAGQTGAVSSPQLHFEVRKGATALDPMKHLSSSTAMN
jgi:murein DD-endopeptidase MepM/ murein hydrolase activator NlpD